MRKARRALRHWISACAMFIGHSPLLITFVNAAEPNRSLSDRTIQGRATEAVIWGMPAVNTLLMCDQMLKANGKAGQIVYWGEPLNWCPDTLYLMGFMRHQSGRADGGRDPSCRHRRFAQCQHRSATS